VSPMLDAAVGYAGRGWHVFPAHSVRDGRCSCCDPACDRDRGKHPRSRNGLLDATTDERVISRWWTWWPDAHVAIRTGAISGIWVLDVDAGKGGEETLADLERQHGTLPDTVTAQTGGGGRHLLWTHPGTHVPTRSGIATGIDVRGDGGYIIAVPSGHVSGRRYAWEIGFGPDLPLAAAPTWLLSFITATASRTLKRDGTPLVLVAGQRNDLLYRLACALRRYGIGEAALLECLAAIDRHHARPPLGDLAELRKIAASAARQVPAERTRTVRVA